MPAAAEPFEIAGAGGVGLRAERDGRGTRVVLAHGITAHRDLVVHGSRALARAGHDVVRYDARAHGESDAGAAGEYTYDRLGDDLEAVIEATGEDGGVPVLAGHSMGAHTIVNVALRDPRQVAGLVVIGPASTGLPPGEESLERWEALADGLERGGADGFIEAYDDGLDPEWRETLIRIARERIGRHHRPEALAEALREVPRSLPFEGMTELESLDVPTLVVASHDAADPGHPYAVAEAYAETLQNARLISEPEGESPLAWQGGRLSREIASFAGEAGVRERLEG